MSENQELKEFILEERAFLHDISNQLVIAQGMGGFVLNAIQSTIGEDSKEFQRMEKTAAAVDKMIRMVRERRELVRGKENTLV